MSVPLSVPGQLGRYRILQKLGKGGMGTVYLAEDDELRCRVALKVPAFDDEEDPKAIERFQRDAEFAQSIHHPYVCPVYAVGKIDGIHYLSMAYIEGTPLNRLIGPGRAWPQQRAAELVRRLAVVLAELHQRKVIHRDLKPHNIMIQADDRPMLMDFGLARSLREDQKRLTRTGQAVGTPVYMPPEQFDGDAKRVGPAMDVYSLGAVLYDLRGGSWGNYPRFCRAASRYNYAPGDHVIDVGFRVVGVVAARTS
jgi:serine/threonine protein kinase